MQKKGDKYLFYSQNPLHASLLIRSIFATILIFTQMFAFAKPVSDISSFQNERLKFDLIYKGLKTATSYMWVESSDSILKIFWTVESSPLASLLFKINNRYETTTGLSGRLLKVEKKIEQKNIKQRLKIVYEWETKQAITDKNYRWPIVENCTNILSMLYDLRSQPLSAGDSIQYIVDVESQIWRLAGAVEELYDPAGNLTAHEIVFRFSPAMEIKQRPWKTDLLTNRLASNYSTLSIQLGINREPLLIRFGGEKTTVEMKLK